MASAPAARLTIMVSSTVYQKEPMLDQVDAILRDLGYRVWMSHKGSVPVIPGKSTYESCLAAVDDCDLYFGIITPQYGSGTDGKGGDSITHKELLRAIQVDKPMFMLAHEQVVNARRLLLDLGYDGATRKDLKLRKGAQIIDDLRLIDMYDAAARENVELDERRSNWVQKYRTNEEVFRFVDEQFNRYEQLQKLLEEQRKLKEGS